MRRNSVKAGRLFKIRMDGDQCGCACVCVKKRERETERWRGQEKERKEGVRYGQLRRMKSMHGFHVAE